MTCSESASVRLLGEAAGADSDPVLDVAVAQALLRQASRGEIGPTIRIYRPAAPTVAFGRIDVRRDGIGRAVQACRDRGFAAVVRSPGGRAVAYTRDAIALDYVCPEKDPGRRMKTRFAEYGESLAETMRGLGVDARVGEVPGEYCPGSFSVNARGVVKLIGTAQRVVRDAWLFSAVLMVDGDESLRPLLSRVYGALDLPFSESSVGSLRGEGIVADFDSIVTATMDAYPEIGDRGRAPVDQRTLAEAQQLRADHIL